MTENIIGAVHSQCEFALSFTNANTRKSDTEVLHDVINDCTIARFEDFYIKPVNGEIQRVQQTCAYDACFGPIYNLARNQHFTQTRAMPTKVGQLASR
jgi:hypothetical protein